MICNHSVSSKEWERLGLYVWRKESWSHFSLFSFFRAPSLTWNGPAESCHFAEWPWKYRETDLNGKWDNTAVCVLWTPESQWRFAVPHDHFPEDKNDWHLRGAFFDSIVGTFLFVFTLIFKIWIIFSNR